MPLTVTAKFLKSFTDGVVPNVGEKIVVVFVDVVDAVPTATPTLLPLTVRPKLLPPLMAVDADAKPELMLRCACVKEFTDTVC